MKVIKIFVILMICTMILLGGSFSPIGAASTNSIDMEMENLLAGYDSDEDGIDDATELMIAKKYAPVLIFDEDEDEDVANSVLPLYQVTPIIHYSGQEGAILVFVFLYDDDYGADIDRDWTDWFTDPIDTTAGLIMDPFDQFFGKHCGDTEAIYFFIANYGNWTNTRLESIYWKRHYDDFEETSENAVAYEDIGDGYGRTHPIIYVSEDKHGMYPDHDSCEDYETDVVAEKIKIPLTPKMEDCSGGERLHYGNVTQQQNVGEAKSENTKNRAALNGTIYAGYDPWQDVDFWGRTDYEKVCVSMGPAGGLGGKWCGNPFSTRTDHPCNNSDWWGNKASSGYCMNSNTDRYGTDYYSFFLDGWDATPCAQACADDKNCVSYSFVYPGYQYENTGVCYLKNGAPEPYYNECCVSGLRRDCL